MCAAEAPSVNFVGWGVDDNVQDACLDGAPRFRSNLHGTEVFREHTLAHFEHFQHADDSIGEGPELKFSEPRLAMMKPTLYAHVLHKVL